MDPIVIQPFYIIMSKKATGNLEPASEQVSHLLGHWSYPGGCDNRLTCSLLSHIDKRGLACTCKALQIHQKKPKANLLCLGPMRRVIVLEAGQT